MIAVIFEVEPAENQADTYLQLAAELRPILDNIEGFISIERFTSLADPTKFLSLSFWENEEAIQQWRNIEHHRSAQTKGRNGIFDDYRLRIAEVTRDYGLLERGQAPADSQDHHPARP